MSVALWGRRSGGRLAIKGSGKAMAYFTGCARQGRSALSAKILSTSLVSCGVALAVILATVPIASTLAQSYRPASGKSAEATALDLYDDAQDAQSRGDLGAAVRNLEELLERFPYSSSAKEGRKQLAKLYSRVKKRMEMRRQNAATSMGTRGRGATTATDRQEIYGPLQGKAQKQKGRGDIATGTDRRYKNAPRRAQKKSLRNDSFNDAFKFAVADRIFFGQEDVKLGTRAREVIRGQAKWLKAHPALTIVLKAYADENGSDEFNRKIARQRGEAVRELLLKHGIAAERVKILALGRENPVAPCATPACAAQNRRVVADVVLATAPEVARANSPRSSHSVPAPVRAKRNRF